MEGDGGLGRACRAMPDIGLMYFFADWGGRRSAIDMRELLGSGWAELDAIEVWVEVAV